MRHAEFVVIGGGIVGLATAYHLGLRFGAPVTVLEKERRLAMHQSGRNSGVLHAGIYYKPGSLKARNCRTGKKAMQDFCTAHAIPFELCGKVVVATTPDEVGRLDALYDRAQANGVACRMLERVSDVEPHAVGLRALHVPETGIVDYPLVCRRLAELIIARGGCICTGQEVKHARGGVLSTQDTEYRYRFLINCSGLYADRVARRCGVRPRVQVVPFRGEYYRLRDEAVYLCKGLIYPVADPRFPFLGVHFTKMVGGGVECGPNAVLAFAREGYAKTAVNWRDLGETLTYPGTLKVMACYWRTGLQEVIRSLSKRAYVRALQRLVPAITIQDLRPRAPGVRAQAVARDGSLVDDFLFERHGDAIHVLNAPSPAATAALIIGEQIAAMV